MPRVETRKARKDYPKQGIKKGDTYYYTKLKLQRGGIEKRSLKPFRQSELTTSPFKSAFYAAQEAWEDGDKDADAMRSAGEAIREIGQEAQGSFDNMPEGLQQGDTGQTLENRASECERIADELDSLADELEGLDEPGEEPVRDTPTDEDDEGDEGDDTDTSYQEAKEEWETATETYESEVERITGEADDLIGDMPS